MSFSEESKVIRTLTSLCYKLGKFEEVLLDEAREYTRLANEYDLKVHRIFEQCREEYLRTNPSSDEFYDIYDIEKFANKETVEEFKEALKLKELYESNAKIVWDLMDSFSCKFEKYIHTEWEV